MRELIESVRRAEGVDVASRQVVVHRAANVLRPSGALARLDELAAWLAGWQSTDCPQVERPALVLAAADHGVVARGVSAYPGEVTTAMVAAIEAGVATSSVIARQLGVSVTLIDAGVGSPTGDIAVEAALSENRYAELFGQGWERVGGLDADLVMVGEMGIGNTTVAAALSLGLFGGVASDWVGRGTGIDDEQMAVKIDTVTKAVRRVAGQGDPWRLAAELGGGELAVLAGVVARCRVERIPVILDGYVTAAAVAPLGVDVPGSLDHCLVGHLSPEPGHRRILDRLGLQPLLDLGLRLGEGSGALVALPILRLAAASVVEVATFEEWGLG